MTARHPGKPPAEAVDRKVYRRCTPLAKAMGLDRALVERLCRAGKLDAVWMHGKTGVPVWWVNRKQLAELVGKP